MKALAVILTGSVILLLLGVFFLNRPKPQVASSATEASLIVEETFFDFGTISMKNGLVSHDFQISNDTDQSITILKLYSSCMCTRATITTGDKQYGPFGMPGHGEIPRINAVLPSREKAIVKVTFDPNAHGPSGIGLMERQVFMEQSNGTKLTLGIRAEVTP